MLQVLENKPDIVSVPLADQVFQYIKRMILSGEVKAGRKKSRRYPRNNKDGAFHMGIAEPAENHYLYEFMERLDATIQFYRPTFCKTLEKNMRAIVQHGEILIALENKNIEEAVSRMQVHVQGITES